MNELHFLIGWQGNQKGAWSGTPEGLYQGLNAKVPVKIQDVTAFKSENRVIISLLKMINGLSGQLLNLKQGRNESTKMIKSMRERLYFALRNIHPVCCGIPIAIRI